MRSRARLLNTIVRTALMWCAGSWDLTLENLSTLRSLQQVMLRKMLGHRPAASDTAADYMHRVNTKIKRLKGLLRIIDWDQAYHRIFFSWAGKVARISQQDPGRLTSKVLMFRNWNWIQNVAARNNGNQLHGRRLHVWRWERALYKYFCNGSWLASAQNKEYWTSLLDDMVSWRSVTR